MTLRVDGVSVRRGGTRVLHEVSLTVEPGQVCGLIGANAAGKTTLLQAIAGLCPTHAGSIEWRAHGTGEARGGAFYMAQATPRDCSLCVYEVVLLGRVDALAWRISAGDRAAVEEALTVLGIRDLAARSLESLSGGQRQLVLFAQALVRRPDCLLLDEPSSALDLRHQLLLLERVRATTVNQHLSTVMALHDLNLAARFADQLVALAGGSVVAVGSPRAVLTPALLAEVFGVEARVTPASDGVPRVEVLGTRADAAGAVAACVKGQRISA